MADVDVACFRCGDPYARHEPGGACRARDGGRCPCLGFLHPEVARRIRELHAREREAAWQR
jgi:hypothetical protein